MAPEKKGSRLSKQSKAIIKDLGKPGEQNRMRKAGRQALRTELRKPGVSKRETRLVKKASRIVKKRTTAGEAKGVRQAFKAQAKRSSQRAGRSKSTGSLAASNRLIKSGVSYGSATNAQRRVLREGAAKRRKRAR